MTMEGNGWTNYMFHAALQSILEARRLSKHDYNTHSFRIGAATTVSLAKFSDTQIQIILGSKQVSVEQQTHVACYYAPFPSLPSPLNMY